MRSQHQTPLWVKLGRTQSQQMPSGLANIFNAPPPFFAADREEDMMRAFGWNLLNPMMRGYRHPEFSSHRLHEEIGRRLPLSSQCADTAGSYRDHHFFAD